MLEAKRLGIAGGILWAAVMIVTTILSIHTGYADDWLQVLASAYPGFTISWSGVLVGAIYGFIDGFVGLALLAWIYNKLK